MVKWEGRGVDWNSRRGAFGRDFFGKIHINDDYCETLDISNMVELSAGVYVRVYMVVSFLILRTGWWGKKKKRRGKTSGLQVGYGSVLLGAVSGEWPPFPFLEILVK